MFFWNWLGIFFLLLKVFHCFLTSSGFVHFQSSSEYSVRIRNLFYGVGNLIILFCCWFVFLLSGQSSLILCFTVVTVDLWKMEMFHKLLGHIDLWNSKLAIFFLTEQFIFSQYLTLYSNEVQPLNLLPNFYSQVWNTSQNVNFFLINFSLIALSPEMPRVSRSSIHYLIQNNRKQLKAVCENSFTNIPQMVWET